MTRIKFGWLGLLLLCMGCAVVTVNVYFPEEDVKMAYDQMEDEFMHQTAEAPDTVAASNRQLTTGSRSAVPSFSLLATPAYAEPTVETTRTFAEIMTVMRGMGMADVRNAYRSRGQREEVIKGLLDLGVIGVTNDGLVAVLQPNYRPADAMAGARELLLLTDATVTNDSATPQFVRNWVQQIVAAECTDRNVIVAGMGHALVKLLTEENPEAFEQDPLLKASMERQARKIFAGREIDRAADSWWIQLPDNAWAIKNPPPPPPPPAG